MRGPARVTTLSRFLQSFALPEHTTPPCTRHQNHTHTSTHTTHTLSHTLADSHSYTLTQLNSTQLNSTQLNSTQLNSTQLNSTQLNSTQLNSTQLNSTQLNSTQLNSTQLNSTQLNSTQLNSTQLNSLKPTYTQHIVIRLREASDLSSHSKHSQDHGRIGCGCGERSELHDVTSQFSNAVVIFAKKNARLWPCVRDCLDETCTLVIEETAQVTTSQEKEEQIQRLTKELRTLLVSVHRDTKSNSGIDNHTVRRE